MTQTQIRMAHPEVFKMPYTSKMTGQAKKLGFF